MRVIKTCKGYAVTNGESFFSKKFKMLFEGTRAQCEAFIKAHKPSEIQEIILTQNESYTEKKILLKSIENKIMKLYDASECIELTSNNTYKVVLYPKKYKNCYFVKVDNNESKKQQIPPNMTLKDIFLKTINPNANKKYNDRYFIYSKIFIKFYDTIIKKKESAMKCQDVVRKNQKRAVKAKKRKKQLSQKGLSGTLARVKSLLLKPGRRRKSTPAKTNTRYVGKVARGKYLYRIKKA